MQNMVESGKRQEGFLEKIAGKPTGYGP